MARALLVLLAGLVAGVMLGGGGAAAGAGSDCSSSTATTTGTTGTATTTTTADTTTSSTTTATDTSSCPPATCPKANDGGAVDPDDLKPHTNTVADGGAAGPPQPGDPPPGCEPTEPVHTTPTPPARPIVRVRDGAFSVACRGPQTGTCRAEASTRARRAGRTRTILVGSGSALLHRGRASVRVVVNHDGQVLLRRHPRGVPARIVVRPPHRRASARDVILKS